MPTVGVDKLCGHHNTADVYSAGGELIGGDCRACRQRYGMAVCTGCDVRKKLWLTVDHGKDDVQRFCSDDCLKQYQARRNKGTRRTVGGKARGRK